MNEKHILKLYDDTGLLVAVQISPQLWSRCEKLLAQAELPKMDQSAALQEFKTFMQSWTYRYPYNPAVVCPICGAETPDWQNDEKFILKTASLGGTLIFQCSSCGANVRQKYFRHNMEVEATPNR